jgi:hypothetical protein
MTSFRGSDDRLDREIETLEDIARVRIRRVARELRDIDRELSELRRERARRRATADAVPVESATPMVES